MFMTYDFSANSVAPALTDRVGAVTWLQADDGDYYEQAYRVGRYCNSVVCVSECIREKVTDLNPVIGERARVIHNSSVREAEISTRKSVARDRLRLVYTGRLVQYQKRVLDFVDLARSLDRRDVPYELTLVGDFSPREGIRETFEARARAHLADGRIRVVPRMPRAQVLDELTRHDVFLLLSDFEGLPLSLIEAMAKGCVPVVAEMESGIAEAVSADENGLILGGRDYDRWAERIAELWESPRLLAQMSKRARKTVRERFTVEHVAMQFDDLFSSVLYGIATGEYRRPPSLHWGAKRSLTGDVLPPPNMYRPARGVANGR
jgi:glycosyltransferase involved in cell wall biosynthesis